METKYNTSYFRRYSDIMFITLLVTRETGITSMEMKSKTRKREIVSVRHMLMFLLRQHCEVNGYSISLREIGRYIGGRDHSTSVHGISKMESLIDSYENQTYYVTEEEKVLVKQFNRIQEKLTLMKEKCDDIELREKEVSIRLNQIKSKGTNRKIKYTWDFDK